ncbi:hypothetical protein EVAR_50350_1 [Eumeta japonica]|uniref:Uncharacterized protein n=1 Tax=Eumeta variegata TaxID=151549 RepID=A0A4C1XP69_EUMVA|nr:hypothetical protein EVAR_50350_1 [Eumeta japonica]
MTPTYDHSQLQSSDRREKNRPPDDSGNGPMKKRNGPPKLSLARRKATIEATNSHLYSEALPVLWPLANGKSELLGLQGTLTKSSPPPVRPNLTQS